MSLGTVIQGNGATPERRRDTNRHTFWDTFPARRPSEPMAFLDALRADYPGRELTAEQLVTLSRRCGIRVRRARRIAVTNGWSVS